MAQAKPTFLVLSIVLLAGGAITLIIAHRGERTSADSKTAQQPSHSPTESKQASLETATRELEQHDHSTTSAHRDVAVGTSAQATAPVDDGPKTLWFKSTVSASGGDSTNVLDVIDLLDELAPIAELGAVIRSGSSMMCEIHFKGENLRGLLTLNGSNQYISIQDVGNASLGTRESGRISASHVVDESGSENTTVAYFLTSSEPTCKSEAEATNVQQRIQGKTAGHTLSWTADGGVVDVPSTYQVIDLGNGTWGVGVGSTHKTRHETGIRVSRQPLSGWDGLFATVKTSAIGTAKK
jgi:hypothetical protein